MTVCLWQSVTYCDSISILNTNSFKNIFILLLPLHWGLWMNKWEISSVQLLSRVWLSATPWTAAHHGSLCIINSQSSLKLMSIQSVMPSSHLILCCPLLLPSISPIIMIFSNESFLHIRGQSIAVSASTSVLPMNIPDWFPLGWAWSGEQF